MDLDPQIFFRDLTNCLEDESSGHFVSLRLLDSFNRHLVEEQIDSALIDLYLPRFFHTKNSLLNFIETSSRIKPFKKSCMKALEILYTVLNNFYARIPGRDILSLYTAACRFFNSTSVDSFIKIKVFDLVIRSLEKSDGIVDDNNALKVHKQLLETLSSCIQYKSGDTVKAKEMELLGYLANKYSFIVDDPKPIETYLWYNFDMIIAITRKASQNAVHGFYKGYASFLENHPLNLESTDDKKKVEKLYRNLKHLVILNKQTKIKMGNRAAISFLANYTSIFKDNLLKEYVFWQEQLLIWLTYGVEEKKVGVLALRAFYQSISKSLEDSDDAGCKEIIQYFLNYCRNVLDTNEVSTFEKRLSVFCLREFSSASRKHLDKNEVTETFLFIMQIFEKTFIHNFNVNDDEWEYLPDYVQTVANFMRFKEFTASEFFCLQKGVISMIKSFHLLPVLHHFLVIDSLLLTMFYLKKTQYFDTFVENVVYQGVVWSCSHQHVSAEAFLEDSPQKLVTVKNYFHLWEGMLKLPTYRQYDKYEYYLEDRKYVLERIINELVKTLMILVNKLNVSVALKEEDTTVTDLEKAYKAEETNDYSIFLNVVDFYKNILENIEPRLLRKCVCKMIDHIIAKCLKYPLTSGFYKLLSYCLKISRQISLFDEETPSQDSKNCRETLISFIAVLVNKMTEFKDDLLISCLQVLLDTPVAVIENMLPSCVAPFINIFEVGRSYLPLAEMGVETLEYWQENVAADVLEPFLGKIIPSLDSFLRSKFLKGYSVQSLQKRRKTMQALKKRKVLQETEPELVKLQRKILCFIGRQSLKNCQNFIFSDSTFVNNLISGQSSHLKVTLPYEDLQLDMYLDTFLPRIIELALYSSDRKTRITSCELLQACVMVFLGRAKPMAATGLEELDNMLKTLVTPLLLLSCDIDQVVRQIFEPLFLQLVHWYTSPTQARGVHTSIVIEALMDGITHPTNSNLKDFSGRCINEFVKWTIKHQNLGPEASIKVLVKNMRFFSGHPDPAKKLGAALIFNNIYRELREEEIFVSIFWLEILHIFVLSLDSVKNFEDTITIIQIKRALTHLQRVIIEKPSTFRKTDKKRRTPNDLGAGLLTDVSIWLLNQTSSRSVHCREACMGLFVNIAPLSTAEKLNLHEFVERNLDNTVSSLYDSNLVKFSSLSEESYPDCASLLNYLRNLLCCLDGYKFIVKNNLGSVNFNEPLFEETRIFLEKLQLADLYTVLNLIEKKTWSSTTLDKEMFVSLKSASILSILKLYNAVLHDEILCDKAKSLWTDDFWKLIANTTLSPQELGLNDINHTGYSDIVLIMLNTIPNKLQKNSVDTLRTTFKDLIKSHKFSSIHLEKNMPLKQRNILKGVILLSSSTTGHEMALHKHANVLVDRFLKNFYVEANGGTIFVNQLQDTTFNYTLSLLKFVLIDENRLEKIIEWVHFEFYVQTIDMVRKISFGLYFVTTFAEAIIPAVMQNFEKFLTLSLEQNKIKITLELVMFVLSYAIKEKSYRGSYKDIANHLLVFWQHFAQYFNASTENMEVGVEYLKLFVQICDSGSSDMQDWLTDCLIRGHGNDHLEIFGLMAKIIGNEVTEQQSNALKTSLTILNEKITSQSTNQEVIKNSFTKLLTFFPVVKSPIIFEYLVETYVNISPNIEIYPLLAKFMKQLDDNLQSLFLEHVYSLINKELEHRYKIAKDLMPAIFQSCNIEVFEQFFVNNIREMLSRFEENDIGASTVHFILVEILFLRIPIGTAERTNCTIGTASKKPILLKVLLNFALAAFKVPKNNDELTRKYKCHAYNALASMVSNSVKKINFYEKLFTRESKESDNMDILWHGIINTDIEYDFPRDFDSLPTQKKILVNIRDELRQSRRNSGNMSKSLQYIESQRLFNSSLSEDVTKFDFTNSVLRTATAAQRKMVENIQIQSEIYLDTTEINNHECMGTICSLIRHIFDSEICEIPTEDDDEVDLPNWMNGIRLLLLSEKTHKNVKIFLVKVIDNMMDIFRHYAKWFLEPFIQFVVDNSAGNTINYFVSDVLVIISKWASTIPDLSEKEAQLASNLLEFFIKNLENDRPDVFKYNIELLKLIVESWKQYLTVPVDIIFDMFSTETSSEIVIYVSSVLLVNGLKPYRRGSEHEFLELMLKQLNSRKRQIYRACSETLGPLLNVLNAPEYIEKVSNLLIAMPIPLEFEEYAICLEGIAIKFPRIVDEYHAARLICGLNQVTVAQKIIHFKVINRAVSVSLDILDKLNDFKIVNWHDHIEDSNLDIQIVTLDIIKKCLKVFVTYPDFEKVVKALYRNVYHPNAVFRSCLYDVAIGLYNLKKDDDTGSCKEILILGLVDADLDNQKKITDFWIQNAVLPRTVIDRFSFLLSEMYKSKIEDRLLGLSTYFLISLLNDSDKYDNEMFEHPLDDCDFEEYKLQTNWKLQHPSVVPMFAETLDVINTGESSSGTSEDQDVFALRRTQTNHEFAPTQSFQEHQLSKFTSLESTLGVDLDTTFKDPNSISISQKYKVNKRRFLKDRSKISRIMAHYETNKQIKKAQEIQESAIEREKKVTIYRNYRKGDFPDIQIALSALLKPLQMLALHDNEISKILFLEIFKGLASKIENNQRFLSAVSAGIKKIFSSSVQFNRYVFSALLDILLKNKDKMFVEPKLISYVALESDLASTGALLIEEYIISEVGDEDGPSTSKRPFRQEHRDVLSWIKLAELYKELEEWDTVRAIFLEKMDCKESLQKAITFESKCLYKEAADLYRQLILTDESANKRDFYYDSYFKCFANLGEWGKIPKAIETVVDNQDTWKGLWEDEFYQQKLLPWYISSHVKNQLFTQESSQEFLDNLNSSLMDSKNGEYINNHFSEELCMMWLCEKDIQTADQYLRTSVKNFLEDWQILNPMFQSQRFQKLLKLQNVIEISDFVTICHNSTDDVQATVQRVTSKWLSSSNETLPSLLLSETKLLYRKQFVNILCGKLAGMPDAREHVGALKTAKILMDIDLINKAADFGNFSMTKKYLGPYVDKENPKLDVAKGTVFVLKSNMVNDLTNKVKYYQHAIDIFENILGSCEDQSVILTASSKMFDALIATAQLLSGNKDFLAAYKQKLPASAQRSANIVSDIEKHAWAILKSSAEKCTGEDMDYDANETDASKKYKKASEAYIKLAHFIRDKNDESLQGDFVSFVLRAMKMNSSEGRQLFPCILMQKDLGTAHKELFVEEVKKIPTWMFLGWIPQLLASVDSPKVFAISEVIRRIAETYPQAIMYPYRLSKDNYNFTDDEVAAGAALLTERLDELLLTDQKINKFLNALSYVSVPANILRYYLTKICKSSNIDLSKKHLRSVQKEVFDQTCGTSNVANMQGNMFTKIERFKKDFAKMKGLSLAKLKEYGPKLDNDLRAMLQFDTKNKPSLLLKDYCPWLANFSANKLNVELEIPGQYDGQKLPLPQHHAKISGFYPEVKIMASLRKPIKITMLGLNTKEYPFLIKFGEDIRQDQRIEQLFSLMNSVLKNDASCANNGLDILTYQVIPLTSNLGLIQWINDTQPLSDFIKKTLKSKKAEEDFSKKFAYEYDGFLNRTSNRINDMNAYGTAAIKNKKEKVIMNYMSLVKKVPWDIMRTAFWTLSTSTENYIALRNNFMKTYSVICATHWILGIGDRHLTNSLICLRNGKVLGIDFGHAFGTATQILPVPELVPFRLTPHIVSLMEPLKERGPFREYMIHCLRCLRANSPPLLATMNVFIQEPSIDWLEHAEKPDDSQKGSWYPLVKIEQAKRKLRGANSVNVMIEELKAGKKPLNYIDAYVKLVKGDKGENLRARLAGREDLSVEDQVDCLIDHATDNNLLGRMWVGWYPWI